MASKRKISTVVAFEGEPQYKQAIEDINKEHKKLKSELELVTAEFKATGDAEKMFTEKSKLLNKQIEGQNKAIKTAEEALKKLKENGVDKTSAAWTHWEKELTAAKTSMFKAQAELNKLNEAYKDVTEAAEQVTDATEQVTQATERATQETADYSETLKSIDKGVKFGNILNGLRVVKDAVGGVISTAFRMGKALVMSQVSGGDWAREIMMGAAAADLSVEEYQARQYAQALSGIEFGPIDESIQELRKRLNSTGEDAVTLFKGMNELGIASRETELQALDAAKAFWDIVNALDEIENADTRNTLAERIFGDKYMSIRSLLNYGGEEYLKLVEEGRAAATVTEESVNALADMDAAVEKVNATTETLKHNVQSQLAPGFTEVANAFSSMLQDLNEFIQSDKGQEVFTKWNEELSGIAKSISEADLSNLFSKAADAASALTDALKWLTANGEGVKYWLLAIGGAFKAIQVSTDVLMFLTLIKNAKELFGKKAATSAQLGAALPIKSILEDVNETLNKEIPMHSRTYDKDGNLIAKDGKAINFYDQPLVGVSGFRVDAKEANERLKALLKALQGASPDYFADQLAVAQMEAQYAALFKNQNFASAWQSVIDRVDSGEIANFQDVAYARIELLEALKTAMDELTQTAESGGGGAMTAFNAAIEKGTLATKDTLKSGVAAAFAGLDSVFASMGTAHGEAYIKALSAQMSRINSMLYASPSYAYGGTFGSAAQSAYASPTSGMYSARIYVGKQQLGQITTPIVNAQLGAEIQTLR